MLKNEFEIFKRLNDALEAEDIYLTIITVGGFVLSHYGMRTTQDIDGFYNATDRINQIIHDIGEEFEINTPDEVWLNNSVGNMNASPSEEICDKLYEFSNLKILMPPLEYIAGMKLQSARGQDIIDVSEIIKRINIETPEQLGNILKKYGLEGIDGSLLLEAFGQAYGMEWLEKYYIEHEREILNY